MEIETIKYTIEPLKIKIESICTDSSPQWRKSHLHDAVEIIYADFGEACVYINNEKINIKKDDIILVNRNVMHYIENVRNASITYLQFEMYEYFDTISNADLYSLILQNNELPYWFSSSETELKDIFFKLKKEMHDKREYYKLYIKSYVSLIVSFMLRNNLILGNNKASEKVKLLLPLAEYIEKNHAQPISLNECCEIMCMTKSDLCHRFKRITGRTLTEYINFVRIRHAKQLLQKNATSTETAFQCGFSSAQYFNRIFKKFTGYTPSEYKRENISWH